ncbi:MAG: alpha/beta hydrolase [Acidobacteria bacterium]|nr:alpha/beta hydrolase [Acidobacteriota bacterium]
MRGLNSVRTIAINGVTLHYLERGRGDLVLFVHGSLSDFRTWNSQIRFFSRAYRVISPSLRYHYPNERPRGKPDYSAIAHAHDLAALIGDLSPGPAHVVASSYGAYASLFLAARRPERVRTLVLGEPPVLHLLQETSEGAVLFAAFMEEAWQRSREALQQGDFEKGVRLFVDAVMGDGAFDGLPAAGRRAMLDNIAAQIAETVTPSHRHFPDFTREDARRVQMPVLLLTGERSPPMFHVVTAALRRLLPNASCVTIPGASHAMHVGNPRAYNDTVLSFFAAHAADR